MNLNVTVNEAECAPETPATPGTFNVRVWYDEVSSGFLFGVFTARERAEQALLVLAGRAGVVRAQIEEVA